VLVSDGDVDKIVDLIASSAQTGKVGDGKIWTVQLGSLMRIRTSEKGNDAI
jgi:nitrogen regulatory protein P-II 1